jgi:serine protease Do
VLKLLAPPDGLKPVRFAEARFVDGPGDAKATVRKGDFVVVVAHAQAAGFPDGSPSASFGIVGNVGRRTLSQSVSDADRIMQPLYKLGSLLHTDARLTVGVSGGAVLNLNGEVIGVTSSVAAVAGSEAAGGYAIPMDANYRRIVESLKGGKEVEYGFLGVSTDPVASGIGGGAVLSQVTPGTPADKAGLRGGELGRMNADRIIAVDGHPVQDMDDLFLNIGAALAGSDVVVTVNRNGRTQDLTVRLAKFRNPQPWIASVRPAAVFGLHVDYTSVLLQDLIQAQDRMAGNAALPRGVVIRDVKPNSPAERELKRGGEDLSKWVITSVNDRAISIPSEFYAAARGKAVVRLKMIHTADPSRTREVTLK